MAVISVVGSQQPYPAAIARRKLPQATRDTLGDPRICMETPDRSCSQPEEQKPCRLSRVVVLLQRHARVCLSFRSFSPNAASCPTVRRGELSIEDCGTWVRGSSDFALIVAPLPNSPQPMYTQLLLSLNEALVLCDESNQQAQRAWGDRCRTFTGTSRRSAW